MQGSINGELFFRVFTDSQMQHAIDDEESKSMCRSRNACRRSQPRVSAALHFALEKQTYFDLRKSSPMGLETEKNI